MISKQNKHKEIQIYESFKDWKKTKKVENLPV